MELVPALARLYLIGLMKVRAGLVCVANDVISNSLKSYLDAQHVVPKTSCLSTFRTKRENVTREKTTRRIDLEFQIFEPLMKMHGNELKLVPLRM